MLTMYLQENMEKGSNQKLFRNYKSLRNSTHFGML